jgi:hypothetical protein
MGSLWDREKLIPITIDTITHMNLRVIKYLYGGLSNQINLIPLPN